MIPWPRRPGKRRPRRPLCSFRPPSPGPFRPPSAPRVVWLGLGGDLVPLTQLFYRLEKAFAALGYPPEGRAFNPHLTLGRVKSPANREKLARLLEKLPPLDWPPFEVKELILFQSVLSPQGSKYTPLQVINLWREGNVGCVSRTIKGRPETQVNFY